MDSTTTAAAAATPDAMAMLDAARSLIDAAERGFKSVRLPCGSRALAFAVESGLEPRMCYRVPVVAGFLGMPADALYAEIHAGRLRAFKAGGQKRGWLVKVDEIDRWLEEVAS